MSVLAGSLVVPRWRAGAVRTWQLVIVHVAWLLCAVPGVTWLGASAAMAYSWDRSAMHGDERFLHHFWSAWRGQWRRTLPLGVTSALVGALLVANMLFLMTQDSAPAAVLFLGTLTLLLLWAMVNLVLVGVVALFPDLAPRHALRESCLLALRHPLATSAGVLGCGVAFAVLVEVSTPLALLTVGLAARVGLLLCHRGLARGAARRRRGA